MGGILDHQASILLWLHVAKIDTKNTLNQQSGDFGGTHVGIWMWGQCKLKWSSEPSGAVHSGHQEEPVGTSGPSVWQWGPIWRARPSCGLFYSLLNTQLPAEARLVLPCLKFHFTPLAALLRKVTNESVWLPHCEDVLPTCQSNLSYSDTWQNRWSRTLEFFSYIPQIHPFISCTSAYVKFTCLQIHWVSQS